MEWNFSLDGKKSTAAAVATENHSNFISSFKNALKKLLYSHIYFLIFMIFLWKPLFQPEKGFQDVLENEKYVSDEFVVLSLLNDILNVRDSICLYGFVTSNKYIPIFF